VPGPGSASADDGNDTAVVNSVNGLVRAFEAYEALGFDDLIVGLRPPTKRSLDLLATALGNRGD
jgi:hypothetical protein